MITTLTLNPAFDVHISIDDFKIFSENLAESVSKDVGGKGINISRALSENGIENTAIIICGQENGKEFTDGLKASGLGAFKTVLCPGRIRENITIHPADGRETRLSFKGFCCTGAQLDEVESLIDKSEYITFTGSLPPGISPDDAYEFLINLKSKGAKLVIDSKSISLEMLKKIKPWLIKPNESEIFEYTGVSDIDALCGMALNLNQQGIENVMISLGSQGAILASENKIYRAVVPEINVISTIGAGDSTIAGFIADNSSPESRLKTAMSYGCAACLSDGTNPPLPQHIKDIYRQIILKRV